MGKTNFIILALILCLSTFPLVQCECTGKNAGCGYGIPDCCAGYSCRTRNYTCQPCSAEGIRCLEEYGTCCAGLTCFGSRSRSTCQPCTTSGSECSKDKADCFAGLTCFNEKCQPCTAENATCAEDSPRCCAPLSCDRGTCQPCTLKNQKCTSYLPCCDGLTCYDGMCQNCAPEQGSDCSDTLQCCGTGSLQCFEGKCMGCGLDNWFCGAGYPPCCLGLGCFNGKCKTGCEKKKCTKIQDCCGNYYCKKKKCLPCENAGDTCKLNESSCCPGLTCTKYSDGYRCMEPTSEL